jgi:DNA modification methylase
VTLDYKEVGNATLVNGDTMEVLPMMEAESVHCVVTSPPYFALRSYLPKDHPDKPKEIGSEATPEAFIKTMVDVFREVRRVLRKDGLLFLNLGDSYSGSGKGPGSGKQLTNAGSGTGRSSKGEESGNLMNLPHRVAEALRADGWIWRQTIVWAKRSPMPESVSGTRWMRCRVKVKAGGRGGRGMQTAYENGHNNLGPTERAATDAQWSDCPGCAKCSPNGGYVLRRGSGRCTTAHEYLFVMVKSNKYFWDSEGCKEESQDKAKRVIPDGYTATWPSGNDVEGKAAGYKADLGHFEGCPSSGRNPRSVWTWDDEDLDDDMISSPSSVWTLSSEPTKVRHFATFPSELVRRCLSAGVSGGGCCSKCGAPWAPVIETERVATRPGTDSKLHFCTGWATGDHAHTSEAWMTPEGMAEVGNRDPERHVTKNVCSGYRATCSCGAEATGMTVLDPFSGIGTVAQTALAVGHKAIGIDLNPEYHEHACKRVLEKPRWMLRQEKPAKKKKETASCG